MHTVVAPSRAESDNTASSEKPQQIALEVSSLHADCAALDSSNQCQPPADHTQAVAPNVFSEPKRDGSSKETYPEPARIAYAFLPALLVLPIWFYAMVSNQLFGHVFREYYPMTVGMMAGSFIAGSTPLGGGVVGFPVAVLVLGFEGDQGRDFSVLIQCVGMNAAAFLTWYLKPGMVHGPMATYSVVTGTLGCILGLAFPLDSYTLSLGFSAYLTSFTIVYFYQCEVTPPPKATSASCNQAPEWDVKWSYLLLALSGIIGGLLTSQLGSGSDCILYVFGTFIWNKMCREGEHIPQSSLTATSVVVMGVMSAVTVLLRVATQSIEHKVYMCWLAAAPIVCIGAPIGSLVLRPRAEASLRKLFYLVALIQLVVFGVLKMQTDIFGWIFLGVIVTCTIAGVLLHRMRAIHV